MDLLYFLLFLGTLIFFHEFGHYLVARLVGVTVVRFSIGFGPRVLGFKRGDTEYCISAVPLGGYVKFLADDPDEVPPQDRAKGFLTTALWRKVLIVIAGPVFNLVLPLLIFLPLYSSESTLVPAVLGNMDRTGPAYQAGLRPGDRVVAIDGEPVRYWWELLRRVSSSPERTLRFEVVRGDRSLALDVTPKAVELATLREIGLVETVGRIEVVPERFRPVLAVTPESPAWKAGLRDGDAVLRCDGREPYTFEEVIEALEAARTRPVPIVVAAASLDEDSFLYPRGVVLGPAGRGEPLGVESAETVVAQVDPESPAARAGIRAGDRILSLDGQPIEDWAFFRYALARDPAAVHSVRLARGGEVLDVSLSLANPDWTPGSALPKFEPLGARNRQVLVEPEEIPNDSRIRYGLYQAFSRTHEVFFVTVAGIYGLLTGRVSVKELGGPIMIYDIAARAGRQGWSSFFAALAWLSMSLGVLNLLPIPVLDGGHLVLFGIEAIRRRPVGRKGRQIANYIGLAFLVLLMLLVFANDIERKWGALSNLGPSE